MASINFSEYSISYKKVFTKNNGDYFLESVFITESLYYIATSDVYYLSLNDWTYSIKQGAVYTSD
jgi:hypothetical protein